MEVHFPFSLAEVAMRFHGTFSAIAALAVLLFGRPATAASISDFIDYSYSDSSTFALQGLLHVPTEYAGDPTTLRPLILFFHGSGESGTCSLLLRRAAHFSTRRKRASAGKTRSS
jgi:predicted peptidase